jgi:hypothetical protein
MALATVNPPIPESKIPMGAFALITLLVKKIPLTRD